MGAVNPGACPDHPRGSLVPVSRADAVALRVIVVYKAIKSVAALGAGLGLLALVGRDLGEAAEHVASALSLDIHGAAVAAAIRWLGALDATHVQYAAAAAILTSVLLAVEAAGLAWRRRWAAWLSVVAGSVLLPAEGMELARHPGPRIALGLLVNLGVVAYLARAACRGFAQGQGRSGRDPRRA